MGLPRKARLEGLVNGWPPNAFLYPSTGTALNLCVPYIGRLCNVSLEEMVPQLGENKATLGPTLPRFR